MANNVVTRFFGGSPAMALVRLVLLSILVGVILSVIGFDPMDIVQSFKRVLFTIRDMGWGAVVKVWRYFLLGAMVVIPIWLIIRLAHARRG